MFKQIQFVRKEIEEHEAVKDIMEELVSHSLTQLVDHPQYSLAVNNWNRKADSLFRDLEKFEIYTRSLQSCILSEQKQPTLEMKKRVLSEKELQIFQGI